MHAAAISEQLRRRETRIFDTDWLVLRRLSRTVYSYAAQLAATCRKATNLGCGSQPYRAIFESRRVGYRGADLGEGAEVVITPAAIRDDDACAYFGQGCRRDAA